jgi:hypothetical protein
MPDKDIELAPYLPDTGEVVIRRWQGSGALFTVEKGASLVLQDGIVIRGGNINAGDPLVKISGGNFTMEGGSEVSGGRSGVFDGTGKYATAGNGGGVYVVHDAGASLFSTFIMKSGSRITGTDVYLETGAVITLDGSFAVNPLGLITPQKYPDTLTPVIPVLQGDITTGARNNDHTDITPERVTGWGGPRYWRVDSSGELIHVIARRFDPALNETVYYDDLQEAFLTGDPPGVDPDEITLLANLEIDPSGKWSSFGADTFADRPYITVDTGRHKRLTVPGGTGYTITRTADINQRVFSIKPNAALELAAPLNGTITIDGANYNSTEALVWAEEGTVGWDLPGEFRLGSGAVLQNNNRTTGHGAAVAVEGTFIMTGGTITGNVAVTGNGGAVFLGGKHEDLYPHTISGGTITGNRAGGRGGAVMLDYGGEVRLIVTGGVISNNRANGPASPTSVNPETGYGGGIFIPSGTGGNKVECRLLGGTIQYNESANGRGNGVAMDRMWAPQTRPRLYLGPAVRILNNDINLFADAWFQDCLITLTGNWNVSYHTPASPVTVTLVASPVGSSYSSDCQVLEEDSPGLVSANYTKFTAPSPHYIGSNGRLYP